MYLHLVKWSRYVCIISLLIVACSPKKDAGNEADTTQSDIDEPIFSSEKYGVSFSSELSEGLLTQAQLFSDKQMDSVILISLLPDCQVFDGKEQCHETTVLSTLSGDSLKTDHLNNPDQIKIDQARFGMIKGLETGDIKKLLPALFGGDKKEAVSFCYLPRHAIAIYGPTSKLSGFIEICFECSESIAILQSTEIPELSQKALNGLGAMFMAYGFDENKLNTPE